MTKSKIISLALALLTPVLAVGAVSELDRSLVERQRNIVSNPGFEAGTAGWLKTAGTLSTVTSGQGIGAASGSWLPAASTASGQYVGTALVAIPLGLRGANCEASVLYSGAAAGSANGVLELQAHDGTNVLVKQSMATPSGFGRSTLNFVCPSGGNLQIRIASTATSGASPTAILIDDAYIGEARNIGSVAQMQLYGQVKITGCAASWNLNSTSMAAFSAQTGCTYTTSGNALAPTTNIPAIRFAQLPPGQYVLKYEGNAGAEYVSGNGLAYFQFFDGTNASNEVSASPAATSATLGSMSGIEHTISYTGAQSNITLQVRARGSSANVKAIIDGSTNAGVISVYRIPSGSEIAYRPDLKATWGGIAVGSIAVTNTSDTVWQTVSTSGAASKTYFGSATAPSTANDFALTMPYLAAGTYEVCTNARTISYYGQVCYGGINDGTSRFIVTRADSNYAQSVADSTVIGCGLVTYTAAQTNKTFSVQGYSGGPNSSRCEISTANPDSARQTYLTVKPVSESLPTPVLVGGVTSNGTGANRIESVSFGGASLGSPCTASPCTIHGQSGGISSVSRNSTGNYTVNFNAPFASVPICSFACGNFDQCTANKRTSSTASSVVVSTVNGAGSAYDMALELVCMGPRQ